MPEQGEFTYRNPVTGEYVEAEANDANNASWIASGINAMISEDWRGSKEDLRAEWITTTMIYCANIIAAAILEAKK